MGSQEVISEREEAVGPFREEKAKNSRGENEVPLTCGCPTQHPLPSNFSHYAGRRKLEISLIRKIHIKEDFSVSVL